LKQLERSSHSVRSANDDGAARVVKVLKVVGNLAAGEPVERSDVLGLSEVAQLTVIGEGRGTRLGNATAVTTNQIVNLLSGDTTATYMFTAANGDTVVLEMQFQTTFLPGAVTFEGTYSVTEGTGRFAGATGSGMLLGSAAFTGPSNGVGSFTVAGTISSPGSLK
jgi:hypothetical protein